jgi:hypothetical protein
MEFKSAVVVSCWLSIALISSVYMLVFGRDVDVMFGVLIPIGFLILIAVIVTLIVLESSKSEK